MLADDVDLESLAANTTRFSGAEIAGVVRAAASYALERYVCTCVLCLWIRVCKADLSRCLARDLVVTGLSWWLSL